MPKYSVFLCGDATVKRQDSEWNDRRFPMPVQNIFALALRTDDREIRGSIGRKEFNRDQFRFVLGLAACCERDVLRRAVWVRTIEGRKATAFRFRDLVFQFRSCSSAVNTYNTILIAVVS